MDAYGGDPFVLLALKSVCLDNLLSMFSLGIYPTGWANYWYKSFDKMKRRGVNFFVEFKV